MEVRIIKGTNQIGGCITEIKSSKGTKIIIDYGENLDNTEQTSIEGLTDDSPNITYDGVFITHSHGDHIGCVSKIKKGVPIYLEEKGMEIHNVLCEFIDEYEKKIRPEKNPDIHFFEFEKKYYVKDITITPYIVDHSCYNSAMFLIEVDNLKVLHTGDYRNHGRKGILFEQVLKKIGKIDLLITEGTTLTRKKGKSKFEKYLIEDFKETLKYDQIYFMCSSTNIDRIVTIYKAVKDSHVLIEDLCMNAITSKLPNIPNSNTFLDIKTFVNPHQNKKEPHQRYINHAKNIIYDLPWDQKFAISLKQSSESYIRKNSEHIKNACLVYSMWDGYIEDDWKDSKLRDFYNYLTKELKMKPYFIHTSGHADIEAMQKLSEITKPDKVIVIHTENKEESHKIAKKIFGKNLCTIDDGETLVVERKQKSMEENLEWKNQKGIRKYFANKKDEEGNREFVIRIREKGDILYYKGIKVLEIKPESLKVSDDVVQFNKASIDKVIKSVEEDASLNKNLEEEVKEKILNNIKEMRQEMFEEGLLKVNKEDCSIKIERKYKENLSKLEHAGLNKILNHLENHQILKVDIEYRKEYKLKKRDKLSSDLKKELDNMLFNFAQARKETLEKNLRDKNLNAKLHINTYYGELSEENLTKRLQEEQEKRRNYGNKEYILSYTLLSSEQPEIKETIQNILCDDENFVDNKAIKDKYPEEFKEEYIEIKDYIIYHINFDSSKKEKLTETEIQALANIEYEIIRSRIYDKDLNAHQISKPDFKTVKGKSFAIKDFESFNDIDNITTKMKDKVDKYTELVKEEVEKIYQFQFMIQDEIKFKIQKANEESKNQIIYPFEQEYFILNKKGRIDAIFFGIKEKTADLYLIELKVNESVIGGDNGVHKHLSDIHELLSQGKTKKEFLKSLREYLNYRRCALDEETDPKKIKEIDKIHFWTIIGYTNDDHRKTSEELLKFYYYYVQGPNTKNDLKNLQKKYPLLQKIKISIPEASKPLTDYIDELNKKYSVDVKFFLDSTIITDKSAYSISKNDFELIDFKNN